MKAFSFEPHSHTKRQLSYSPNPSVGFTHLSHKSMFKLKVDSFQRDIFKHSLLGSPQSVVTNKGGNYFSYLSSWLVSTIKPPRSTFRPFSGSVSVCIRGNLTTITSTLLQPYYTAYCHLWPHRQCERTRPELKETACTHHTGFKCIFSLTFSLNVLLEIECWARMWYDLGCVSLFLRLF